MSEDSSQSSNTPRQKSLLRFLSKKLEISTRIETENDDWFVVLSVGDETIGKRRLAKRKCCESSSPCIGTVPIKPVFQLKYELPSFVHVSLCYAEFERQLIAQDHSR